MIGCLQTRVCTLENELKFYNFEARSKIHHKKTYNKLVMTQEKDSHKFCQEVKKIIDISNLANMYIIHHNLHKSLGYMDKTRNS